jgi:hypothetical protein
MEMRLLRGDCRSGHSGKPTRQETVTLFQGNGSSDELFVQAKGNQSTPLHTFSSGGIPILQKPADLTLSSAFFQITDRTLFSFLLLEGMMW